MGETAITALTNNSFAEYKQEYAELNAHLQDVKDKQGAIGSLWDGVKNFTGVGVSEKKCDSMLEKFKNGEIDFEEATEYIEKYEKKQSDTTDLIVNILTGTASIAATIAMGCVGAPLLAVGAGIGALAKTGLKFVDRATNKVENDEFDSKLVAKDILSGAVTGAVSAVQTSMFSKLSKAGVSALSKGGLKAAQEVEKSKLLTSGANGFVCGAICGGFAGGANYLIDAGFGDKKFNVGDLAASTLSTAAVSAPISGVITMAAPSITSSMTKTVGDCTLSAAKKLTSYEVNQIKQAVA